MLAAMTDEAALKRGLGAHEKGGALRRKRITALVITRKEIKADQDIHDGCEAAFAGASGRLNFLNCLWSCVQRVEDTIFDRGFQHEGRHIPPGKLHDAFRCYRWSGRGWHKLCPRSGKGRHNYIWCLNRLWTSSHTNPTGE